MAVITIFVPKLERKKFTGGIWTIYQYADGLAKKGHRVTVFPVIPSPSPDWYKGPVPTVSLTSDLECTVALGLLSIRTALRAIAALLPLQRMKPLLRRELRSLWRFAFSGEKSKIVYQFIKCAMLVNVESSAPQGDCTVATAYQTALAVSEYGSGMKYYFLQHFESVMCGEARDAELCLAEVHETYNYGLNLIANSSWVKNQVESLAPQTIPICLNAINHETFHTENIRKNNSKEVMIISYGGRNAKWKGFAEMAEAMRIARQTLPDYKIVWRVYGDALLPPDNSVAQYESLGFLMPTQLAEAYRNADILLSASWYESFPLFPLEAMACGLAVITTAPGTEDYAIDGETAVVVPPQEPRAIADALVRLVTDPEFRAAVATKGREASVALNWPRSVNRMEEILIDAKYS